jgi:hypothetical protein
MLAWWKKLPVRERQWIVTGLVLAGLLVLAITKSGPFSWEPPPFNEDDGFFEALLAERYTLGLVRLGLMALGLFIVLSVPALIVAGRWLKGFSKEGLTADEAINVNQTIVDLEKQVRDLTAERDTLAEAATQTQLDLAMWRGIVFNTVLKIEDKEQEPPAPGEDVP